MKGISRFTINKNRNGGCGYACIDQGNEMACEPLPSKSLSNEIPLNSVKSFSKIKFQQKSLLFPRFKVKGVDDFLSYDNVRSNVSSLNKSSLTRVDDTWKVMFDSVSKRFGNYFI